MRKDIVNQTNLSYLNKARIIKEICSNPHISRATIAKHTGLTSMTVSNIVGTLIQENIVIEESGRKPILLNISDHSPCIIGINITRSKVTAILCDYKAKIIARKAVELPQLSNNKELQNILIKLCTNIISQTDRKVLGIGVSSIGPIDTTSGVILDVVNFYGLHDIPIAKPLACSCKLPVFTIHDSNAAAVAEKIHGKAQHISNFMHIIISSGIGCGFILNNHLYTGDLGLSGEIGRIFIHQGDTPQVDLESHFDMKSLAEALKAPHTIYSEKVNLLCEILSFTIANIVALLDIHTIIIEYPGFAQGAQSIEDRIEELVNQKVSSSGNRKVSVLRSAFRGNAPIIGAASVIINKIFRGEIPYF